MDNVYVLSAYNGALAHERFTIQMRKFDLREGLEPTKFAMFACVCVCVCARVCICMHLHMHVHVFVFYEV